MFDAFKKIFGPKEWAPPRFLELSEIPAIIQKNTMDARDRLRLETEEPVRAIGNGFAELQHIVNSIDGAQHDPIIHPKLKSIAKNSLPQFVKATNVALAKDLPEDVEMFYPLVVESVKGCLNSTRGQGRHLASVFPEEMKNVKMTIDKIGREINAMNKSLSSYHAEIAQVQKIQELYDALCDIRRDKEKSVEKERRITSRIEESAARIDAITSRLHELGASMDMQEVEKMRSDLAKLETARDDRALAYTHLSMMTSHVLRKAEKVAARQQRKDEVSSIHTALRFLADHELPDPAALTSALTAACMIAHRMIENGEIVTKNKEERISFSDPVAFCLDIGLACSDLRRYEDECRIAHESLVIHPLLVEITALEREKIQKMSMLGKEQEAMENLERWIVKTKEDIPIIKGDLEKKIEAMIGESVQLIFDDHHLA